MKISLEKKIIIVLLMVGIIFSTDIVSENVYAASSKNVDAKKAYNELLSKSTISWGSKYSTSKLKFSCMDINADGISELIVENEAASYADGFYSVYAYISGKVKCIWTGFSDKPKIYPDKGVIYDTGSHMEDYWEHYYKFAKNKVALAASYETHDKYDDYNYINTSHEYKVAGKASTKSKYNDYINELTGYVSSTSYTLVKNTSSNRSKYLVKTLCSYKNLGIDTSRTISNQVIKKMNNKKLYYYKSSTNYDNLDAGKINTNKTFSLAISPSCKYYLNDGSGIEGDCLKQVSYSTFQKDSYWRSIKITIKNDKVVQMVQLYMP